MSDRAISRVLPLPRLAVRATANVLGVGLFVALMTVGAKVSMPLAGSPVPVTLQTIFVPLAGLTLGPYLGAAAMAAYLALGLCGAPVFAMGGGPAYAASPTFGYMLPWPAAAWLAGKIGRPKRLAVWRLVAAHLAAHGLVFLVGVTWLAGWLAVTGLKPWTEAAALGLLPFLPGTLYKVAMGLAAAIAGWMPARLAWPYFSNWNCKTATEPTES
jgi:biotin transport system substrate-specific component